MTIMRANQALASVIDYLSGINNIITSNNYITESELKDYLNSARSHAIACLIIEEQVRIIKSSIVTIAQNINNKI